MKTSLMLYIICSVLLKRWHEKERNKLIPEMIARNIEYGSMRVNIRRGTHC